MKIPNQLYLNGEYVDAKNKATFTVRNPKDGSVVAEDVPIAGNEDVDLAVQYAQAAFNGPWSKFTAAQRSACMLKICDLLDEKVEDILRLDSMTMGNPVSLIPTREKGYIQTCFRYFGMKSQPERHLKC